MRDKRISIRVTKNEEELINDLQTTRGETKTEVIIKALVMLKKSEEMEERHLRVSNYLIDNDIFTSQDVGEKDIVDEFDKEVIEKLRSLG